MQVCVRSSVSQGYGKITFFLSVLLLFPSIQAVWNCKSSTMTCIILPNSRASCERTRRRASSATDGRPPSWFPVPPRFRHGGDKNTFEGICSRAHLSFERDYPSPECDYRLRGDKAVHTSCSRVSARRGSEGINGDFINQSRWPDSTEVTGEIIHMRIYIKNDYLYIFIYSTIPWREIRVL